MPSNPKRKGVSTRASTKRQRGPANPPITPQTASKSVGQSPLTKKPPLVSQPSLSNQPLLVSQPLLTNQPSSISQPSLTSQPSLASQTSLTNQPAIFSQPPLTNQPSMVSQPSFPQPVYVNPPQEPSKIRQPINSIEMWSDAFINFILVHIQNHIVKASDLLKYMTVIRGAAVNNPISKWLVYDMQFRLRTSKDPKRSSSRIDGHLWLSFDLSGGLSATCQGNAPCYEYNFKGSCSRMLCNYAHVCIRCKVPHPASSCNLFNQRSIQPRFNYGQNRPAGNHSFALLILPLV